MQGTNQRVLFDHYSKKNKDVLLGKTDNNRIVEANADSGYLNKFVNVKVAQSDKKNLQIESLVL